MTQYFTGSEVTRPESLLDLIMIRSAYDTPMIARYPHETTTRTDPEWTMDEPFTSSSNARNIAQPHANTKFEGADFTYGEPNYPVRMRTICEIQHHGVEMSGSDRAAELAGAQNPWDYRVGQKFTEHMNSVDNTLLYGLGSPEAAGSTGISGDPRKTQGLISWSAWTGQERMQGTGGKTSIQDVHGVEVPSSMWSVFYNADHSPVTLDSFYSNLVTPLLRAGADMDRAPWQFQIGYTGMQRVSRFIIADGGVLLNDRNRGADEVMANDYLNTFRLASGHVVSFRTNRWLDEPDASYTIDNTQYPGGTPGSPSNEGTLNYTYQGNQTIIGNEPGAVKVLWYREPAFRNVATDGDYSRLAVVSEFGLRVDHLLSVAGMGNALG